MANTYTTLGGLFTAIANAIRAKKGTSGQIIADTFPDEIASITTGTDVSDANAVASDVASGKTFYAGDGTKKTGNVLTVSSGSTASWSGTGQWDSADERVEAKGGVASDMLLRKGSTVEVDISDANLIPSNIKSGVSIFGVNGSLPIGYSLHSGIYTKSSSSKSVTVQVPSSLTERWQIKYILFMFTPTEWDESSETDTYGILYDYDLYTNDQCFYSFYYGSGSHVYAEKQEQRCLSLTVSSGPSSSTLTMNLLYGTPNFAAGNYIVRVLYST